MKSTPKSTLTIRMVVRLLDLAEIPEHISVGQLEIPKEETEEDWEPIKIITVPAVLYHINMKELLTSVRQLEKMKTTKRLSNEIIWVGEVPIYLLVPERHLANTCYDCKVPLAIYSFLTTVEVLWDRQVVDSGTLCPACVLRRNWRTEARSDPEYTAIEQARPAGMLKTLQCLEDSYVSQRESDYLRRWTQRDSDWWIQQKRIDANSKEASKEVSLETQT
jgi:hypothetical protein